LEPNASRDLYDPNYDGILLDWWTAINATQTVQTLIDGYHDPELLTVIRDGIPSIATLDDLQYLLMPEELWARSYLQYITVKTGDEELLDEIQETLAETRYLRLEQWPQIEFIMIENTIDDLFRRLGWR
jgi:hypothetical protein